MVFSACGTGEPCCSFLVFQEDCQCFKNFLSEDIASDIELLKESKVIVLVKKIKLHDMNAYNLPAYIG